MPWCPPCSYFLGGQQGSYAYSFQNSYASLDSSCPVYVNYNLLVDNASKLWGFGVDVTGASGLSLPQGWISQTSQTGSPNNPAPGSSTNGVAVMTDPLPSIVEPTVSTCTFTSYSLTSGSATLSPGTYCGTNASPSTPGMTITNASVTLNPGLYIITGGVKWQHANVTGTGVTLFFTNRGGLNNYGYVQVGNQGGNSVITLSAPTDTSSGGIPGILFFCSRNWISSSSMDFVFNTATTFNGDGIWYMPNTGLYMWQNSFTVPHYGSLVVRNTYFFGTTVRSNGDYSWLSGGSPFRKQGVIVQ